MSKINFPKKQEQRLIPKYLLEYSEELVKNHPDPSESWGGSGSTYTAGEGIVIENNEISVDDETVAMVANLAPVAFSGSYSDLSNKPDLSVYELKSEAFSGDYDDLTDKPDLSVYELKADAFSGDYDDLTNKPTIPTDTLDLTNGAGYITGINSTDVINALGYTPGTSNFSGNYNDLTNKPTIPTDVTNITLTGTSGTLSASELTLVTTTPEKAAFISGTNYLVYCATGTTNVRYGMTYQGSGAVSICTLLINKTTGAWTYTATANNIFSGDYNDLSNKPTIPVVPTDVSAFTNDAGYITSADLPTNYVTTDTNQDITGVKTFTGSKKLLLKPGVSSDKPGFTTYLSATKELGFLESRTADKILTIGANISSGGDSNNKVAFRYYSGVNNTTYNLIAPDGSSKYNAIGSGDKYIPIAFTNGTNTVESNAGGLVNIIPLLPTVPNVEYANGDKFSYTNISTLNGYLTSAGKVLQFSITTPKLMNNITSITVDNLFAVVRGISGYVGGSSYVDYANTTGFSVAAYIANENTVTIQITATTAYSGGTNNTPVALAINPSSNNGIKLTFNS